MYTMVMIYQITNVQQGRMTKIDSKDDKKDFELLKSSLAILQFTEFECETIFKLVACVLHIGNIHFIQVCNVRHAIYASCNQH